MSIQRFPSEFKEEAIMKTRALTLNLLLALGLASTNLHAQSATEPLGGKPPAGSTSSIKDFDYQVKYQRAFESVLWGLPAVAIYRFRGAAFDDLGLKNNDIITYSAPAKPNLEALTANSTTPYITAFSDLQKGP